MPHSPLLPAAATGTVDTKSIVDPIRSHLDKACNYFKAEALQINVKVGASSVHGLETFPEDPIGSGDDRHHRTMTMLTRKC